jgi:hypothetical protein
MRSAIQVSVLALFALLLNSCRSDTASNGENASGRPGVMIARDDCPRDDNQIIQLEPGDRVQIYQSVGPVDPEDKKLPPDSPLSKKLNLTYVKVLIGASPGSNVHIGEYCWASTVNVRVQE